MLALTVLTFPQWVTIGGTILSLVVLEGLLSADNALVLAVMVRHLPRDQQRRALRYGIFGAFFFRFVAVLLAARILDYWQFEVIGGLYLLYLAIRHLLFPAHEEHVTPHVGESPAPAVARSFGRGFWGTVIGVELADIAFSIDSILAAVAMAAGMPKAIQAVDLGFFDMKTAVIYIGGILGIITMRYVAGYFILVLEKFPGLAKGAYYLVGWIGLKLIGGGLHHALYRDHKRIAGGWRDQIPEAIGHYLEMPSWFFWSGMALIIVLSLLVGPRRKGTTSAAPPSVDPQVG
jgi:YkoY family integral membrane protein